MIRLIGLVGYSAAKAENPVIKNEAVIARTTINLRFIETLLGKIPFHTPRKKVAASAVAVKSI
jgi:hypothetical protein